MTGPWWPTCARTGGSKRIRIATSSDEGLTWGPVGATELPNPGSGLDGVRLANGHWLLVYNDTTSGRNRLAVSVSKDEGSTWTWTRHLEAHDERIVSLSGGHPRTGRHDPRRVQLFRLRRQEHEACRVQRGLGAGGGVTRDCRIFP